MRSAYDFRCDRQIMAEAARYPSQYTSGLLFPDRPKHATVIPHIVNPGCVSTAPSLSNRPTSSASHSFHFCGLQLARPVPINHFVRARSPDSNCRSRILDRHVLLSLSIERSRLGKTPVHRVAWQHDSGPALGEPSKVGRKRSNPSEHEFAQIRSSRGDKLETTVMIRRNRRHLRPAGSGSSR